MNEVVWYHSDEAGAPTINNVAGSLINVLDACLIDGFNSKTLTSLVVASGVATATASAHGYEVGKMVLVAGATPSGLNGRKKIASVPSANTFTFDATGISNQTATGTITTKRAPLGWTKEFTGTAKAIYARTDPAATQMRLRVDDSGVVNGRTDTALALMVETASGIDTYTERSPLSTQITDGMYWEKGAGNSTPKKWIIVGDSRTFYYFGENDDMNSWSTHGRLMGHAFGDIKSYRAGDPWACVIAGSTNTAGDNWFCYGDPTVGVLVARAWDGIVSSQRCAQGLQWANWVGGPVMPIYPSPVDNGMVFQKVAALKEADSRFNNPTRGELRGLLPPQAYLPRELHLKTLTNFVDYDREVLVVTCLGAAVSQGAMMFDITGPWAA